MISFKAENTSVSKHNPLSAQRCWGSPDLCCLPSRQLSHIDEEKLRSAVSAVQSVVGTTVYRLCTEYCGCLSYLPHLHPLEDPAYSKLQVCFSFPITVKEWAKHLSCLTCYISSWHISLKHSLVCMLILNNLFKSYLQMSRLYPNCLIALTPWRQVSENKIHPLIMISHSSSI